MAFRPHGDDLWPESVAIPTYVPSTHWGHNLDPRAYRDVKHTLFKLTWYYNAKLLEGCHNIKTPPQGYKPFSSGWVSPAYDCAGCDYVLLVPFPEVETTKELHHWLQKHLEGHL